MTPPKPGVAARLVDYFLVVGAGDVLEPIPGQDTHDLMQLAFVGEVIDRFPSSDHPDMVFPPGIAMFCLPEGLRFTCSPGMPTFHTFASTVGTGDRLYGACLHFFEPAAAGLVARARLAAAHNRCASGGLDDSPSNTNSGVHLSAVVRPAAGPSPDLKLPDSVSISAASADDDDVFFDAESGSEDAPDDASEAAGSGRPRQEVVYAPKCIVILSQWNFLTAFRGYLSQLYRLSLTPSKVPIERYLCNLMREVPVPPRGRVRVQFSIADYAATVSRAPPNDPLADSAAGFPLRSIFECLSVEKVVLLFECLLLERRIVLLSSAYSLLTSVCECLLLLMYPFRWQHVYIPLLPEALLDFLNAPMPFLIGTHKKFVRSFSELPETVVVVDLDSSAVLLRGKPPRLPDRDRSKLVSSLKDVRKWQETLWHGQSPQQSPPSSLQRDFAFDNAPPPDEVDAIGDSGVSEAALSDKSVRQAFFRVFVSMFKNYRDYLVYPSEEQPFPPSLFRSDDFMQHMPSSSYRFLMEFLATQAFHRFVEDRVFPGVGDKDVLYFDESIIAKLNRSKFAKKRPTPFLDDANTKVVSTFVAPGPDLTGLNNRVFSSEVFPQLDESLFTEPRMVKSLLKGDHVLSASVAAKRLNWRRSTVDRLPAVSAVKSVYTVWFTVFTAVASAQKRAKLLRRCFDILDRLHAENITPDVCVYRDLIEASGQCACPEQALKLLEHMQRDGIVPDATIYSALFTAFSTNGDLSHAYHTLGRLKKSTVRRSLHSSWVRDKGGAEDSRAALDNPACCIERFERTFDGLTLCTVDTCPDCGTVMTDECIRRGWRSDANDYTTQCNACPARFVARFLVRQRSSKAAATAVDMDSADDTISCEYLSPNVLQKEVHTLLRDVDGNYLCTRQFRIRSPTVFWNLAWHLTNLNLPISFLVPWMPPVQVSPRRHGERDAPADTEAGGDGEDADVDTAPTRAGKQMGRPHRSASNASSSGRPKPSEPVVEPIDLP